jgi:hypothetical protein
MAVSLSKSLSTKCYRWILDQSIMIELIHGKFPILRLNGYTPRAIVRRYGR